MMGRLLDKWQVQRIESHVPIGITDLTNLFGVTLRDHNTVTFLIYWGTITDASDIKVQQSSDDGSSDPYSDVAGSALTTGTSNDTVSAITVRNPTKEWQRLHITRNGATGAEINAILAFVDPKSNSPQLPSSLSESIELKGAAEGTP